MPLILPSQFYHLLPLDDKVVVYHAIPMVVTQKPVIELTHPLDHLEEIRQPVRGVISVQLLLNTGGSTVGQDTVYLLFIAISRFLNTSSSTGRLTLP